tara:strand:- start:71 stop:244 length:174 start_codon:yes stop_codon:yes gene_type:complete
LFHIVLEELLGQFVESADYGSVEKRLFRGKIDLGEEIVHKEPHLILDLATSDREPLA